MPKFWEIPSKEIVFKVLPLLNTEQVNIAKKQPYLEAAMKLLGQYYKLINPGGDKMTYQETSFLMTRDRILRFLLMNQSDSDGCTVKEIAEELALTPNGVRQHLTVMEKEKLVVLQERKGSIGRPSRVYMLHEGAIELFPKIYADFSVQLLDEITNRYGVDETVEVLKNIGRGVAQRLKNDYHIGTENITSNEQLKQRIDALVKVYIDHGKYPKLVEEKDCYLLQNYNCLIHSVCKRNAHTCKIDEMIIKEVLGAPAVKERDIKAGRGYCQYKIYKIT